MFVYVCVYVCVVTMMMIDDDVASMYYPANWILRRRERERERRCKESKEEREREERRETRVCGERDVQSVIHPDI